MCVKLSKMGCSDASPAPALVASPWEDGTGLCKAPQPSWGALSQPRSPTAPSRAAALPSGKLYAQQCPHTMELSPSRCHARFVALLGEGFPTEISSAPDTMDPGGPQPCRSKKLPRRCPVG